MNKNIKSRLGDIAYFAELLLDEEVYKSYAVNAKNTIEDIIDDVTDDRCSFRELTKLKSVCKDFEYLQDENRRVLELLDDAIENLYDEIFALDNKLLNILEEAEERAEKEAEEERLQQEDFEDLKWRMMC